MCCCDLCIVAKLPILDLVWFSGCLDPKSEDNTWTWQGHYPHHQSLHLQQMELNQSGNSARLAGHGHWVQGAMQASCKGGYSLDMLGNFAAIPLHRIQQLYMLLRWAWNRFSSGKCIQQTGISSMRQYLQQQLPLLSGTTTRMRGPSAGLCCTGTSKSYKNVGLTLKNYSYSLASNIVVYLNWNLAC